MTNIDMVFGAEVGTAIRTVIEHKCNGYRLYNTACTIAELLNGWGGNLLVFDAERANDNLKATVESISSDGHSVNFRVMLKYGRLRIPVWNDVNWFNIQASAADLAYYCPPVVLPVGFDVFGAQ